MKVGEFCKRLVVTVAEKADVVEVAGMMRAKHVGFLVVVAEGSESNKPVGVITDRDIVLQVTAREVDPRSVTAADVMTREPLLARESDDLRDLLQAMRTAGIRRVPVVDSRGALTGVVALDDILDLLTDFLCDIAGSIKSEQRQEWRSRAS